MIIQVTLNLFVTCSCQKPIESPILSDDLLTVSPSDYLQIKSCLKPIDSPIPRDDSLTVLIHDNLSSNSNTPRQPQTYSKSKSVNPVTNLLQDSEPTCQSNGLAMSKSDTGSSTASSSCPLILYSNCTLLIEQNQVEVLSSSDCCGSLLKITRRT